MAGLGAFRTLLRNKFERWTVSASMNQMMTFRGAAYDLQHREDVALVGSSIYKDKKARDSITS